MNRSFFSLSLTALLACSSTISSAPSAAESPPVVRAIAADDTVEVDALRDVLPTGAFPSIARLCARQRDLILPKLEETNGNREGEELLTPSCEEDLSVLDDVPVTVGGPISDVKAIQVETGASVAAFLVVRTDAGWTAVRQALLSADHDDPGCPSIERENAIVEVRVERGALVVSTSADRVGEEGHVVLTQQRSCTLGAADPTCTSPETVDTTVADPD